MIRNRKLLSGAESIAYTVLQLGVEYVTCYPGTPATSIFTALSKTSSGEITLNWSVNEKIALEEAAGAAMLGVKSLCIMKHYGLNVCSDFLGAISLGDYLPGGLVIIVGDDPGGHSSRSEQDSRHYGKLFNIPVLELVSGCDYIFQLDHAYKISSIFNIPVLVRVSTRLLDTYLSVDNEREPKVLETSKQIISIDKPVFSSPAPVFHKKLLDKKIAIERYYEDYFLNAYRLFCGKKLLVIATGRGANLMQNLVLSNNIENDVDVLPLITILPFPGNLVSELCEKYERIAVIEEGDGIVEDELYIAFSEMGKNIRIAGKRDNLFTGQIVPGTGELNIDVLNKELLALLNIKSDIEVLPPSIASKQKIGGLLCSGCPHSGSLFTLKKIKKELKENLTIIGDTGCYTMGIGDAGYNVFDTIMCMGSSISLASGMQQIYIKRKIDRSVVAVIGDSTFFHSGISPLIQVIKRKIPLIIIVLDNKTVALTGGQNIINSSDINLVEMINGLGIKAIELSPYDVSNNAKLIINSLLKQELIVYIFSAPCVQNLKRENKIYYENIENKCFGNRCPQHECLDGFRCAAMTFNSENKKIEIDPFSCVGCGICSKLCKQDSIIQRVTDI